MKRLVLCAIVAGAFAASSVGIGAAAMPTVGGRDGLQLFAARVASYAELHQRLDARVPPAKPSDDVNEVIRRRESLGWLMRAARSNARQGDIFDPVVAVAVRDVIANALNGLDVEGLLVDLYEDCEMPAGYRPLVNGMYPDWAVHEMPVVLLMALPQLPEGIQYRLVDHDLLLWDVDADVIIDVLPDALPTASS